MAISLDKAFGIHQHALLVRSDRAELIASNIANADTPGYKAKDLDFADALAKYQKHTHIHKFWLPCPPSTPPP